MIGIGINQDVVLTKVAISDKGNLELSFAESKQLGEKKSIFDEANSAAVSAEDRLTVIRLFVLKKPSGSRNEGKTDDELLEMVSGDIKQVKNQLSQLLEQFMPSAQIVWDAYKGTGVDKDNYRELLLKTDILESVSNNYFTQFINMVSPFLGKKELSLRMKLVRQSQDKNFPTIPGRYLDEQPWVELMDVPEKASRVKFSQWEKDNGYDSAAAVKKTDTDDKDIPEATPEAKQSAFRAR